MGAAHSCPHCDSPALDNTTCPPGERRATSDCADHFAGELDAELSLHAIQPVDDRDRW
jgi:hypothetical protein